MKDYDNGLNTYIIKMKFIQAVHVLEESFPDHDEAAFPYLFLALCTGTIAPSVFAGINRDGLLRIYLLHSSGDSSLGLFSIVIIWEYYSAVFFSKHCIFFCEFPEF